MEAARSTHALAAAEAAVEECWQVAEVVAKYWRVVANKTAALAAAM
jgi:hypothetical protein